MDVYGVTVDPPELVIEFSCEISGLIENPIKLVSDKFQTGKRNLERDMSKSLQYVLGLGWNKPLKDLKNIWHKSS